MSLHSTGPIHRTDLDDPVYLLELRAVARAFRDAYTNDQPMLQCYREAREVLMLHRPHLTREQAMAVVVPMIADASSRAAYWLYGRKPEGA